jgi:hypothetical protein
MPNIHQKLAATLENPPCTDLVRLSEKVAALETWRITTEIDLKAIRDVISQVKLLMSLSIGGGGLSVLTLIVTIVTPVQTGK